MNRKNISINYGRGTAIISLASFLVWIICFTAIFIINPPFSWTNLSEYIAYSTAHNQSFKFIAQLAMLLFAPAFVVLVHSIEDQADENRKFPGKIAVSFALMFAVCVSIHYFVQISSVRLSIASGETTGLEQFIQSNPYSGIAGINLVGWSLFFSIACLFLAPVFPGQGTKPRHPVCPCGQCYILPAGRFRVYYELCDAGAFLPEYRMGGAMGTALSGC